MTAFICFVLSNPIHLAAKVTILMSLSLVFLSIAAPAHNFSPHHHNNTPFNNSLAPFRDSGIYSAEPSPNHVPQQHRSAPTNHNTSTADVSRTNVGGGDVSVEEGNVRQPIQRSMSTPASHVTQRMAEQLKVGF